MSKDKADTDILSRTVCPPGRVIFRADEAGLSAYLIRSGTVEIYKLDGAQEVTIAELGPGEMFGEMALFNSGRRSTYARAKTAYELAQISGNKIERLLESTEPGVKALVRILVRRMNDLTDKIETCPLTGKFRIKDAA